MSPIRMVFAARTRKRDRVNIQRFSTAPPGKRPRVARADEAPAAFSLIARHVRPAHR
jgi:hypothetical protein